MNQGIAIQGPTQFYTHIADSYSSLLKKGYPVVWATWEDEPKKNIDYIRNTGIEVILLPKPSFPGYLNINMQTVSAIAAINHLISNYQVKEILKARGDVLVNKPLDLLKILKGKQAAFIGTCKEGVRKDIYYELVYPHYSHDYPDNNFFYGSSQNVHSAFNFYIEELAFIPPESLVAYHLMQEMGVEFNLNFEYMKSKGIHFYFKDCLDKNITFFWLKHNTSINETYLNTTEYDW